MQELYYSKKAVSCLMSLTEIKCFFHKYLHTHSSSHLTAAKCIVKHNLYEFTVGLQSLKKYEKY